MTKENGCKIFVNIPFFEKVTFIRTSHKHFELHTYIYIYKIGSILGLSYLRKNMLMYILNNLNYWLECKENKLEIIGIYIKIMSYVNLTYWRSFEFYFAWCLVIAGLNKNSPGLSIKF